MKNLFIPIAIVIGFGLVASAIYLKGSPTAAVAGVGQAEQGSNDSVQIASANPSRGENRLLYGNPEAETTIVEFSDFECPFCARVHPTIKRIVDESEGAISWEYRHLPLPKHRTAGYAAVVGECVARRVSNEAFWTYADSIFGSDEARSTDYYLAIGQAAGASLSDLEACVDDTDIHAVVEADMAAARAIGGNGTPYSVVVFPDGTQKPINGALPYEHWVSVLGL